MIQWLNANQGAVTTIAAIVMALANIILAIVTYSYVRIANKMLSIQQAEHLRHIGIPAAFAGMVNKP